MLGAALIPMGVPSRYAASGSALMTPDEARLPVARAVELPAEAHRLAAQALELEANRRAPNTRRAYESDFDHFTDWCSTMGLVPLPATPEAVYLYLCALVADDNAADYAITTLDRRLAAITYIHETSGHPVSPAKHVRVRELMAGIRRTYGRPLNKRDALTTAQLHTMVAGLDLATKRGLRDRAILLIGYAGAFRRSELAPLRAEQLRRRGDGYVVSLVRTKSDQESHGREVGIPAFAGSSLCPVTALDTWLTAAAISTGPVFRKVTRYDTVTSQALAPSTVALIVKRAASAAAIPPGRLAGHSLRSGHATTAAENGAPDRVIMRQTGHRSVETLEGYIRSGNVLRENSARYLNLEDP
ncbi:MAG: site-specific integrase [Acidimicrobiales bacterium]